tara:strand:+ start:2288 stop:3187 length:900 start_codon:yes stop_codon:yes gene_type:complete
MSNSKPKVLVIAGATASGKTSLSIQLAKTFSGEIISADSRQIYKTLDIGTGKVTPEEMGGVPHHMIDIINPEETYTAAEFKTAGAQVITEITARGNMPIIAGGTFFYVDTLLGRITSPEVEPNPKLRATLEQHTTEELYNELRKCDPRRAEAMDPHNKRRLIRALEIVSTLGSVPAIPTDEPYEVLTIGIQREKEELRDRFSARAKQWLEVGFMAEICTLLNSGLSQKRLQEIGFEYTLGVALYNNEITQEEFLQKFIEKNWQYAKKQIMWLKKDKTIQWFKPDGITDVTKTVSKFLST